MPATTEKYECINPETGRRMKIDRKIYDRISKAIFHVLKKHKALPFTELVEEVDACIQQQKTPFEGSLPWYTITVKKDMEARGVIKVHTEKGEKLNMLAELH